MRKYIARYVGFPMQDFKMGTEILATLSTLRESQYWDETKIYEYRLDKLRKLVSFAATNVPYYEMLFKYIQLKPSDIKSLEDIRKIPVLTKSVVRENTMDLIARGYNMKYVKKGKTGGTTGVPIIVLKDTQNRSFTWASYYRWFEWMGVEYGDKIATLWGAKSVLGGKKTQTITDHIVNLAQNRLRINSFKMSPDDLGEICKKLVSFKPVILNGYLSSLIRLANYIEENAIVGILPKVVSSTSETLLPNNRKYLERIFNAPLFDQYGCGELSAISYECPAHKGLHINQEHMILEILDTDDNPVYNYKGRVIGTDLDNFVMPFIRYENGDVAEIYRDKCTCGINQPLMSAVDGRETDTLTLSNGSSVHGVFLIDILYELGILANEIQRFQAIQKMPGQLELNLETSHQLDVSLVKLLDENLRHYFDKVEIKKVSEIENESNGKFKYIKSMLHE